MKYFAGVTNDLIATALLNFDQGRDYRIADNLCDEAQKCWVQHEQKCVGQEKSDSLPTQHSLIHMYVSSSSSQNNGTILNLQINMMNSKGFMAVEYIDPKNENLRNAFYANMKKNTVTHRENTACHKRRQNQKLLSKN